LIAAMLGESAFLRLLDPARRLRAMKKDGVPGFTP
jgi:hypothetical protein